MRRPEQIRDRRRWAARRFFGEGNPLSEHETVAVDQIRNRMMRVLAADPATETVDLDAGPADEPAVEQSLIDKLAGAAVAGDGAARDRLIAEVHPLVLGYCRRRLSRREAVLGSADDVAQEICIAVVAALQSYVVSGRSFRSFVFGIAANKVADAFRAMSRNRTEPMAELPDGPVLHDGPEQRLLDEELAERLAGLLQRLTPRQRTVLVLRIVVGLSAEETAEELRTSPGAVRVTQHRALNRLRAAVSGTSGRDRVAAARRLGELRLDYAS
jgi:RNA polymerase sigma-70 factor, ECF subfamily